jgi:hypothetical protein
LTLDFRVRPFSRADRRPGLLLDKERSPHSSTPGFGLFIARSEIWSCSLLRFLSSFIVLSICLEERPSEDSLTVFYAPVCSSRHFVSRCQRTGRFSCPVPPLGKATIFMPIQSVSTGHYWVCHRLAYLCLILIQERALVSWSVWAVWLLEFRR